jgi:hypothetical protein
MPCIQGQAGFFNCSTLKMKVYFFEAQGTTRPTAKSHISEVLKPHKSTRPTQFNVGANNVNSSSVFVFGNGTSGLKNRPTTHVSYVFVGSIFMQMKPKNTAISAPICFITTHF